MKKPRFINKSSIIDRYMSYHKYGCFYFIFVCNTFKNHTTFFLLRSHATAYLATTIYHLPHTTTYNRPTYHLASSTHHPPATYHLPRITCHIIPYP